MADLCMGQQLYTQDIVIPPAPPAIHCILSVDMGGAQS